MKLFRDLGVRSRAASRGSVNRCVRMQSPSKMVLYMQMLLSRISEMEWRNGMVEWNGGMEYTLMHLLTVDKFTYSFALQLII